MGFRIFVFMVFKGSRACRFAKQIGAQASGDARALRCPVGFCSKHYCPFVYHSQMLDDQKSPQYMTSQELEEAIRKHREYAKRLVAEARMRREEARKIANQKNQDS